LLIIYIGLHVIPAVDPMMMPMVVTQTSKAAIIGLQNHLDEFFQQLYSVQDLIIRAFCRKSQSTTNKSHILTKSRAKLAKTQTHMINKKEN
jgi:hypothetical protein